MGRNSGGVREMILIKKISRTVGVEPTPQGVGLASVPNHGSIRETFTPQR